VEKDYERDRLVGRITNEKIHGSTGKSHDQEYMHKLKRVMSVGKWVFPLFQMINNYEINGGGVGGCSFIFILIYVHSSPNLFVCGDDRITCYPGANDVTVSPEMLSGGEREKITWGFIKISLFYI